jgi:hypothetical protein
VSTQSTHVVTCKLDAIRFAVVTSSTICIVPVWTDSANRAKNGVVDRVLLTSPDRLARNYVHQMVLIEEWERCGCKVEFLRIPKCREMAGPARCEHLGDVCDILEP